MSIDDDDGYYYYLEKTVAATKIFRFWNQKNSRSSIFQLRPNIRSKGSDSTTHLWSGDRGQNPHPDICELPTLNVTKQTLVKNCSA